MSLREALRNGMTAFMAVAITFLVLELGLRLYHGEVFDFVSELRPTPNVVHTSRADYHPQLGWVPSVGVTDRAKMETVTNDGLRSNGANVRSTGRPILTVGDSFTFGNEVPDSAMWPAQLGRLLDVPVLNGGVFAYGVDQAFLRATTLLEAHNPTWVVLAFIKDDVNRTQFSYYSAWKPYYQFDRGELLLRNTPVPRLPAPKPRLAWLRTALGHSLLASALARRYAEGWWYYGTILRQHSDGVAVATELVSRLRQVVQAKDARLLVLALSTGGRIGSNEGMPAIVNGMRRQGIEVLDLVSEVEAMVAEGEADLFMPGGHYSPRLNGWVAGQVAKYVDSVGAERSGDSVR